ncbi:enoyl-CoA hydratase/isomerase family protein [Diaminobutyricibacter tongyongensis]|uniref:Enoyl-CoA hydratase/isomerase family protein n=1 Tax=Leifsonia tongyongensis TaxID=1268043 RepID=A0A6L9XS81_9MICO|nr:enoyl-CoA hydratase/isomerase family protein [Diaminobutyricibacter tongyongensis]NEN04273.1 enoyl-CoA hydratase/isomerase family protein [Diaminobutyricibacter tongyongensis]
MTTIAVDRRPDRVTVRLDRPETRNAINQEMVDELHEICAELEASPRILIILGGDGVFASGADIAELRERRAADAHRGINARLFARIAALPLPVIAAIDGYALGGGAELAYAADFRIGTPTLRIGNPETGLGIIAAAGALWRLRELVGEPLAKEILLAGRILDADEALAVRLVTELHAPDELEAGANALADRIAANDPLATQYTKAVFHAPDDDHPRADQDAQAILFESPEKIRRMTDFLERRRR